MRIPQFGPRLRLIALSTAFAMVLSPLLCLAAPEDQDVVRVSDDDNYERIAVPLGQRLHVRLKSNASTGFSWQLASGGPPILQPMDDGVYRPGGDRPGEGGFTIFRFNAVRPGTSRLVFRYARPSGEEGRTFVIYARVAQNGPWPKPTPPRIVTVDDSDNREQITVSQGQILQVNLKSNVTTGYSWRIVQNDPRALQPMGDPRYVPLPADGRVGSGGSTTFQFRAQRLGLFTLVLSYRQAGNPGPGGKTFRVQVFVV